MENQRISVWRQKNRPGLTALCIVLCLLLSPLLGLTITLPQVLAILPVVLLSMLAFVGPISALTCCALVCILGFWLFGMWGAASLGVLLIPPLVLSVLMVEREQPFWQSVAAGSIAAFVSMGAAVGLLSIVAGSDLVTALTEMIKPAFESVTGLGDSMLVMLAQMGLLTQPEGLEAAVGAGALTEQMRSEMIASLELIMDYSLRLEIPKQMTTGALGVGLLGQAVLRKGLRARGNAVECPPLRTWRVPKGWGRVLGITLAAFFLLAQLLPEAFATTYYVFSGIFRMLFALQGVAAVCYVLHKRGRGSKWQAIVFVIGYFFAAQFAEIAGIADQAVDFTHRREALEKESENPETL